MKRQDGYVTKKSRAWLGHYSRWVTDHSTGKRKRHQKAYKISPVSAMTKAQAENKLRERIVSELGITADSRVTLGWFIENRWKPLHEDGWRDSTKAVNAELLKFVINRFGATPIEDMDAVAMQSWLGDLAKKKSGSLVIHSRIFLRSIMAEALEQEYLRKNPARLLRLPRLKAVQKPYLSLEEIKALFKAAMWQPRERTLLTVMLVTGFRPSELFALRWKCFDSKQNTLTIAETIYRGTVRPFTKTTEEGDLDHVTVLLSDAAMFALLKWHAESYPKNQPDNFIFPNSQGGRIHKENYQKRVLNPLAKSAGIARLNFQILRRTVATHAQRLGSPKDIAEIMRHRRIETAQKFYIQAIGETVRQTVEALSDKMFPG